MQRGEGGKWMDFPLLTKTDQSGQFTAYVELGQPGHYQLRVLDRNFGVVSKPFVLASRAEPSGHRPPGPAHQVQLGDDDDVVQVGPHLVRSRGFSDEGRPSAWLSSWASAFSMIVANASSS